MSTPMSGPATSTTPTSGPAKLTTPTSGLAVLTTLITVVCLALLTTLTLEHGLEPSRRSTLVHGLVLPMTLITAAYPEL